MLSKHELSIKGEKCWQELQTHIEWSDKFELFILFTHNPLIAKIIRERVTLIFSSNEPPIHYFEPTSPDTLIADVFDFLRPLENENLPDEERSPIWLEVSQWSEQWAPVQKSLIERLNERRDRLRKHHPQPFVIVLNGDFAQELRTISPDLWSVRCYSRVLTPDFIILPKAVDEIGLFPDATSEKPDVTVEKYDDIRQHPTLKEWQRLVDKKAEGIDVFYAGFDAFNIAFNAQFYHIAKPLADSLLFMAHKLGGNPNSLRTLVIALSCKGEILEFEGELQQAKEAFSESLTIARRLQTLLGDQPYLLGDISVALNKIGNVELLQGNKNQALAHYSESLALFRKQQQLQGDQPGILRDIGVSLEKLGNIHQSLGHSNQALAHFSESLALFRQLHQMLGDQPQMLRDISISLEKLGDINHSLGHSNQALAQLTESLALFRQFQQFQGDQPGVLRGLFASLTKLAHSHQHLGAMDIAKGYYQESIEVIEQLKTVSPEEPDIEKRTNWVNKRLVEIDTTSTSHHQPG